MLIHRDEVKEEALLLLVGDWIKSADSTLADSILFGLLPYFFLYRHSHMTAVHLSVTVSKSVLAAQHPLLSGMKDFVKKKGRLLAYFPMCCLVHRGSQVSYICIKHWCFHSQEWSRFF